MKGPYLKAALLCENLLEEGDKSVSAIRIVDRLVIPSDQSGPPEPPYAMNLRIFISVVAGDEGGGEGHSITVSGYTPSGKVFVSPTKTPAILPAAPESTFNIRGRLLLETSEEGLHWFHVLIDDVLAAKIPMTVEIRR